MACITYVSVQRNQTRVEKIAISKTSENTIGKPIIVYTNTSPNTSCLQNLREVVMLVSYRENLSESGE